MGISGISIWQMLILLIILLPIYFLPTIVALVRNHRYKTPIILINIFGGLLLGIGWFVALILCFIFPPKASVISPCIASEIEKLHALKERSAITQAEFDKQKSKLLGDS